MASTIWLFIQIYEEVYYQAIYIFKQAFKNTLNKIFHILTECFLSSDVNNEFSKTKLIDRRSA